MSEPREFPNDFPDYDESLSHIFDTSTGKLKDPSVLIENIYSLLKQFEKQFKTETPWEDQSVYTGMSGVALMYMRFMDFPCFNEPDPNDFLKSALNCMESVLPNLKKKHYTFLCGAPGPLSIAAVLFRHAAKMKESKGLAQRLENLERDAINDIQTPDELLYGRCGYLYSLLYVQEHLGKDAICDSVIRAVVESILKSGKYWAKRSRNTMNFPLYYEWHDKAYVGGAHGFAGIFYMLLQAKDYMSSEDLSTLVKPSIDLVMSLQFPSGNFPSSLGNNTDRLIHWCHGAPGVIHLMLLAYEVFSEEKYLDIAKSCGTVIWNRGLLRKGYGICHGVAGNGYAFLRLFQVTKDIKYVYKALKFGEWCYDYGKHGCRIPDRPLSLFEGMAGTIYYLLDLLDPLQAKFPAFQLS